MLIELIILTKYWNFELRWSFLQNYLIRNAVLESNSSAFLIPKFLFLLKCVSIASLEGQFICLFCFRKLSLISSLAGHYKIRKKKLFLILIMVNHFKVVKCAPKCNMIVSRSALEYNMKRKYLLIWNIYNIFCFSGGGLWQRRVCIAYTWKEYPRKWIC